MICGRSQKFFTQGLKSVTKTKNFSRKVFFLENFIWKHRMQLWKPHRSLVDGKLKNFSSESEGDGRPQLFQKLFFSLKNCPMYNRMQCWQPYEFFWQKVENYFLNVQNCLKKSKLFPEKNFASKCSSRDREIGWRSGNLAEFFLTKSWNVFAQGLYMFRKLNCFQKEIFFASNCSFGRVESSFDNPNGIFLAEAKKNVHSISEIARRAYCFFLEKTYIFLQRAPMETQNAALKTPPEN